MFFLEIRVLFICFEKELLWNNLNYDLGLNKLVVVLYSSVIGSIGVVFLF